MQKQKLSYPDFPRITEKEIAPGKVERTVDTGMFIFLSRSKPGTSRVGYRPINTVLDEIESAVSEELKSSRPEHVRDIGERLIREITEAREFIRDGDIQSASAACLYVGRLLELVRVSALEPEFIKRRRSVEATRKPRRKARTAESIWPKIEAYWRLNTAKGCSVTWAHCYHHYVNNIAGKGPRIKKPSFERSFRRNLKKWKSRNSDLHPAPSRP